MALVKGRLTGGNMKIEKTDLKRKAYDFIKEKIVKCELMPGEDISEDYIIQEIGISRTPIREALIRLEQENLVRIFPRKGIFVSNMSARNIIDVFQVREIVEPQVIHIVADKLSLEWLKDIRKKFAQDNKQKDFWDNVNIDKEFHSYLISACDNMYLKQLMDNIYTHNQRMRVLSFRMTERSADSNKEHIGIIDALIKRNVPDAEEKLRNHIQNAKMAALNISDTVGGMI